MAIKIKVSKNIIIYGCPKRIRAMIRKKTTLINPEWKQNQAMKRWNGNTEKHIKAYEYGKKTLTIPTGLLDYVLRLFKKNKVRFDLYDTRIEMPVNFLFTGFLKPLQVPAAETMLKYENGILEAATGAGKTVVGLNIIAAIGQKTLIIVHTKNLMEQWFSRIQTFMNVSKAEIGMIGDDYYRIGRRITIGIASSVIKHMDELNKEFGCVFVDECHRTPSFTFSAIMSGSFAKYKFGVSATPYRSDGLTLLISWYIGPERHVIPKDELIANNDIMQPAYIIRSSDFVPAPSKDESGYQYVMKCLVNDETRNKLICRDIDSEIKNGHVCIVLSDRKKHCRIIQDMLKNLFDIESEILTGEHKGRERRDITNKIDKKEVSCVIATGQLIGEGADFKHLSALFLITPIKFTGRLTQYIGRVMRFDKNKKQPLVYDYVDWDVPMFARSGRGRIKEYGADNVKHM